MRPFLSLCTRHIYRFKFQRSCAPQALASLLLCAGLAAITSLPARADIGSLTPISDTLGGTSWYGGGVSADGSTVVGDAVLADNSTYHAFRWTQGTGMADLGTLGGTNSFAYGISADSSVVVGSANTVGNAASHAFRWTQAGGMVDLGTLGGTNSDGYGVSADGSVIVGDGNIAGDAAYHAYRWTQAGGMVDLGTLGGTLSFADGVSADGRVVVGASDTTGDAAQHAFRWTQAGGMADLGTLGGTKSGFYNVFVSADGNVVVGDSQITGDSAYHAFRWTQTGGMADLGMVPGDDNNSYADGVSATGKVVVGSGDVYAFRWTQATGMQNLNTLLSNAGVNMTGITLTTANGVSSTGQYIAGSGAFSGTQEAFLVEYIDATVSGQRDVIAGMTTAGVQQVATQALATSQQKTLVGSRSVANTLLGMARPVTGGSFTEAGGIFGSAVGTVAGQYSVQGVTVLGGLSYGHETTPGVAQENAPSVALALRYTFLNERSGKLHPYVEAGGWVTPREDLTFSRPYANGAGIATGEGATVATQWDGYGKLGVAYDVTPADQLNGWGDLGREYLSFSGYSETISPANPFPAVVQDGTARMDVARSGLSWTHRLNGWLAVTASGALAHSFDVHPGLNVAVAPIGTMSADGHDSTWGEYGARFEIGLTDRLSLNLSAEGTSGGSGVGTSLHGGGGISYRF